MVPLDMPLQEASIELAKLGFEPWLKNHGKPTKKEMTRKQELELRECFELIDSGGSGTIPTHEVPLAFAVLGMDVKKPEIDAAIIEFNANKRSMEYTNFSRLMLSKLHKIPDDKYAPTDEGKDASTEYTLPFALLAQAYRRKKLIEAVMGGDKPLQDRMNYRSAKAFRERKALLEPLEKAAPKTKWPMTVEPTPREKKRAKAASLKKSPKPELPEPPMHPYVIQSMDSGMQELLLGEKRQHIIKAAVASEVKFVPPTNKSIEIERPWSGFTDMKASKAYLKKKLTVFREDMRHKPTMKKQVIHVQATKALRDIYNTGTMQVKGSPFLYPAARRKTMQLV